MGTVIYPEEAEDSPCTKLTADGGGMVFSKGVLGPLTDNQEDEYCAGYISKRVPSDLEHVWERMRRLGVVEDVCLEDAVSSEEFPKCVELSGKVIGEDKSREELERELADMFGVKVD